MNISFPPPGLERKLSLPHASARFTHVLPFDPEDGGVYSLKCRVVSELHGSTIHKIHALHSDSSEILKSSVCNE
jgi:hypothetical protein